MRLILYSVVFLHASWMYAFHLGCLAWGTGVLPLMKDGNDSQAAIFEAWSFVSFWGLGELLGCCFGGLEACFGELVAAWSLGIGGLGR